MKKPFRILIADDHDIIRRGIRPLIESEWGWEICGEASNGTEAVTLAEQLTPDLVVLDVAMPGLNGVDATREIKRLQPTTEVLAFTGTNSETLVRQLFAAGARGCVLKADASQQLIPAIKALQAGKPFLAVQISQMVFESYLKGGTMSGEGVPDGLSSREREIIRLLAEGKSNKEVGSALDVSVKTVESIRSKIMRKLDFTAFSELVRYAVRNLIVPP